MSPAHLTATGNYAIDVRNLFEYHQIKIWDLLQNNLDSSVLCLDVDPVETEGPISRPLIFVDGALIEKAACNFTHSHGESLPPAASARNPHLAGKPFSASSLSVIIHPRHPHIPTAHMNVRFFLVQGDPEHWHFGGGMDLTPHFLYEEDAQVWHANASLACTDLRQYDAFKSACDEYFYLPHREEGRGIGGLFFDDLNTPNFATCLEITMNVCMYFHLCYENIFKRRMNQTFTRDDELWMLHRRSRYAEFNLIHDRGTKYGLQSGRQVESVLASLPPRVEWNYDKGPANEAEREMMNCLKEPRDWLTKPMRDYVIGVKKELNSRK